jgi:cytidylate kinase
MGNSLMNYLNKRLKEEMSYKKDESGMAGPVITISREVGCNGVKFSKTLAARLNAKNMTSEWKVLSKEIFHESARELNLEPEKVRKVFKKSDSYTFDQILKAFGDKNYKSEKKIVKTVTEVVKSLAADGFCIIVGRAGHIIASDIKNALHLRFIAPLDFRVHTIMENNRLNYEEALAFINKVEKERIAFRKAINEENLREELFDLTINRASFSDEQTIELIEYVLEQKKILEVFKPNIDFY